MTVIGPAPLLRHNAQGCLELQEEGLTVLRRVGAPLHVVFTIGGSRCGKSTICNALLYGQDDGPRGFQTGSSFDPVTSGVDVAAKRLPGGGALILADCEGAFHIMGSALSARGFGAVGFLAYHLSSVVVNVTMGSIDERDIEALGHLAATAEGVSEECLRPAQSRPELMLLVNGARFELGEAVARRLLQPPDGAGRGCARSAIAAAFGDHPALEALPNCEHEAYWPKVEQLRTRILESAAMSQPSGMKASGLQLAERMERLLIELGQGTRASDPVSAAEHALRSLHLDPLVEDIAKKFTLAASSAQVPGSPSDRDARAVSQALKEFDERSAWLSQPGSEAPRELLLAVRQRLAARLEGIAEAVQRGRAVAARLRTPSRLERLQDARTPTPPHTPGRRTLAALLAAVENTALRVEALHLNASEEIKDLEAALEQLKEGQLVPLPDPVMVQEDSWQRLQDFQGRHRHQLKSWHATSQEIVEELKELQSLQVHLPDVSAAVLLQEARGELEALRLARPKVVEGASRCVERCLEDVRQACEEEIGGHTAMRERITERFESRIAGLRDFLDQEVQQRRDRHQALVEVVAQMSKSLESTVTEDDDDAPTPSPAKPLRTPGSSRWKSERRW